MSNSTKLSAIHSLKLSDVSTENGQMTMQFLAIRARNPDLRLREATPNELYSLRRHVKWPWLINVVTGMNESHQPDTIFHGASYAIPTTDKKFFELSAVMTKTIRASISEPEISRLKIFPQANDGEIISWCKDLKKLASTRHKNILLRLAHGDIL